MKRRDFIIGGLATAAGIGAAGYFYLDNEKMDRAPEKEGKIILDLHCHPSSRAPQEDIMKMLSWGITALSTNGVSRDILSYEEAAQLPGAKELEKGVLAKLEHKGSTGYFLRAQEIMAEQHILAIGFRRSNYVTNCWKAMAALQIARKESELVILPHPYISGRGKRLLDTRMLKKSEEPLMRELCSLVDEIESFNAFSVNAIPGLIWLNKANVLAKQLAQEYGFHGIAVSDAHLSLRQVKISGIYIPDEKGNTSIEGIVHHVKSGNFERLERYVSRMSIISDYFLKG